MILRSREEENVVKGPKIVVKGVKRDGKRKRDAETSLFLSLFPSPYSRQDTGKALRNSSRR
jgi:hypothetical protein